MPSISRFFGVVIYMFHRDHYPPHFHAEYAEHKAIVEIGTTRVIAGRLPPRVLGLVAEWAALHAEELQENWRRARNREPLMQIAPLG